MPRCFAISMIAFPLALTGLALGAVQTVPLAKQVFSEAGFQAGSQGNSQVEAPSDAEMRERGQKLIANQHSDDEALEQFDRIERHIDRTSGANPRTLEDKTYRVVPTGTGTLKLLVKTDSRPVDPAQYRQQLQTWENVLELMLKPDDQRAKAAYAKYQKRKRDRAELVDAMRDAFVPKWLGREARNGRSCDVIKLDPNPNFHPRSTFQDALTHATAKIWVDHDANQLVRGEAHIMRDISFGGGILGKLYRGGVFSLEQAEMEPGVWLPTRYQYDFMGRKFVFMFEEHQLIEAKDYRRIGTPRQGLALVRSELASGKSFSGDP